MAQENDEAARLHPRRDLGFCELGFRYRPGLISTIRRFIRAFYGRLLPDEDGAERLALTVHELLEGIAEVSADGDQVLRVEVFQSNSRLMVCIRAKNLADAKNGERLRQILAEINGGPEPGEAYRAAMRASLDRDDGALLRLARVRAEAKMRLVLEEGVDGRLTLVASTEIGMDSAA